MRAPCQNRAMIRLNAQIDSSLAKLAGKDLPFVASSALNRTAVGARDLVRDNLPKRFKLRNSWTRGGIQARMSSKAELVAAVVAPPYMAIQEAGGTRTPNGSRMLAAPSDAVAGNQVIPKARRPRALLQDGAFIIGLGAKGAGVFERYGKKRGQIRLLWWLSDEQRYEDRFEFEQDVRAYTMGRFEVFFAAELAKVLPQG